MENKDDIKIDNIKDRRYSDNNNISKSKVVTYILLTFVFMFTSFLSLFFIYKVFSDQSSFLSLTFITLPVLLQLVILLVLYFLFDTLRFFYILKTIGVSVHFGYMFRLTFINMFISNITPLATGGGFTQIYFLNKRGVPVGDATAGSTIRTLLPILFFFISTPFILLKNQKLMRLFPGDHPFVYIGFFILIYGVAAYFFYRMVRNMKFIKTLVYNFLGFLSNKGIISKNKSRGITKKFFRELESFSKSFKMFFQGNVKDIVLSITFTFLFLLSLFVFPVILTNGMGYHIPVLSILSFQIVVTFITYFAITPGASGIAEGGFSLLFASLVSEKDIVSLTFTWRLFSIYIGVILGLVIFYFEFFNGYSKVKKESRI